MGEQKNIPPAGGIPASTLPSVPTQPGCTEEEAAFEASLEGFGIAEQCAEFELVDGQTVRFDDLPPIKLERRGLTSQAPGTPDASAPCRGRDRSNLKSKQWQREFWASQTQHKNSVAAKLRETGHPDLANGLEACHSTFTVARCNGCGDVQRFPNRCDQFYCPECQPRLSADRRQAVEWWVNLVEQPKHVVLTIRNIPDLTRGHVQEFKRWWGRLRRRKFARNWRGGFYTLELTNEGNGWHLHLHALVDAKWIDGGELSREWSSVTGGAGYIVKVKDARRQDYLAEVTKYAVKGTDLAKWPGQDIATFIAAFTGVRAFGVFGDLYGARTEYAEFIASLRDAKPKCECGCGDISYYTEAEWLAREFTSGPVCTARPPPAPTLQPELFIDRPSSAQALAAMAR